MKTGSMNFVLRSGQYFPQFLKALNILLQVALCDYIYEGSILHVENYRIKLGPTLINTGDAPCHTASIAFAVVVLGFGWLFCYSLFLFLLYLRLPWNSLYSSG